MKKLPFIVTAIAFLLFLTVPAIGAPKFVLTHYYTWDADMIDSDEAHYEGYTGEGVYIAVLDSGLTPAWKEYFPRDKIATKLAKGFFEPMYVDPKTGDIISAGFVKQTSWVGSTETTHGTHVISTILGYNYHSTYDAAAGLALQPIYVEGIAPDATIIPVKVLKTYHLPPYTGPGTPYPYGITWGSDLAVAAGIRYVIELKQQGYSPMIISMSIGAPEPSPIEKAAIDDAIEAGIIVIAAAGNDGTEGMDWPGAYPDVISVGACGWKYEWYWPGTTSPLYRLWWLQENTYGYNDIPEPTLATDVYVCDFSGRENQSRADPFPWAGPQELDILAPGSWVRGPLPGWPGYNHIPWWSKSPPWAPHNNFYYAGGTSMATPHVSAVAAMMLEKNEALNQTEVEDALELTALYLPAGSMVVYDLYPTPDSYEYSWGGSESTGYGVIDADEAVDAVSTP